VALSTAERAALTFTLTGVCVGAVAGAMIVWFSTRHARECTVAAPAPAPIAAPVAAPAPVAVAEPVAPTPATPPAEPVPLTWMVNITRAFRHGENPEAPGFAMRVDLAMTRLRANPATVDLRAKTTCHVGAATMVETVGFAPPPGAVLIGESGVGTFIDPFYWQRLPVTPSRCDLQFLVDGVGAGRFCVTPGEPITVVAEPCPALLEAPLPTAPAPVTPPAE